MRGCSCQGREQQEYWESLSCSPGPAALFCVPWVSPDCVAASAMGVPKLCHCPFRGYPQAVSLLIPWVSPDCVTVSVPVPWVVSPSLSLPVPWVSPGRVTVSLLVPWVVSPGLSLPVPWVVSPSRVTVPAGAMSVTVSSAPLLCCV